jgi:hypothetical protein
MSSLGTPSSKVDPEVARFWRAVKLLIEGNDPLVKRSAVTTALRDLEQGLTPTPGIIPAPTGLIATGLFAKILLEWNAPADGGAYTTEVYRSQTDDLGTAVMVLRVPPELTMVVDDTLPEVSIGQTYYYWIRFSSETGVSLFNQAAGTAAATATDPAYILEILAGEITSSQLHATLTSRIDLIDTPTTGLVEKMAAVESEIDTITTILSELQDIPVYDALTTYALDDMVSYDGGLYRALGATTGNLPTNTTYWEKVGDYASLGEAVAAHAAQLSDHETRITDNEGDITAEATARETLATQMRGAYTGTDIAAVTTGLLFSEKSARSTADSTEVTARQALSTKLTGVNDPASKTLETLTSGLIYDEKAARSDADGTIAYNLSTLSAQVNHATTGLPKAHALIVDEQTARVDGDGALSQSISALSATVGNKADTTYVTAQISTEAQARVDGDSASAQLVTNLKASISGGANLLPNSDFAFDLNGYHIQWTDPSHGYTGLYRNHFEQRPPGMCTMGIYTQPTSPYPTGLTYVTASYTIPIEPGERYCLSAYLATSTGATIALNVLWNDGSSYISEVFGPYITGAASSDITKWNKQFIFVTAPSNARFAQVRFVRYSTGTRSDPGGYVLRPMFERATPDQTQPSPWAPSASALYAVKTDVNGKIAGFGLTNDGTASLFEIVADRFAICNTSGTGAKVPFVVDATAGVVMDTALIKDGTITNAKIGSLAVDAAKIAGATITGAKIANATITGANIATATITSANIANATITNADIASGTIVDANIATGTITSAKIGSAQVKNANIENLAVTELKVGGNAITSLVAAKNTTATTVGPYQKLTMVSVSITVNYNQPVVIAASALLKGEYVHEGGYYSEPYFEIIRNSVPLYGASANTLGGYALHSLNLYDSPGNGTHIYYFNIGPIPAGVTNYFDEAYISVFMGKDNRN